jgi:hypothetical protein
LRKVRKLPQRIFFRSTKKSNSYHKEHSSETQEEIYWAESNVNYTQRFFTSPSSSLSRRSGKLFPFKIEAGEGEILENLYAKSGRQF